MAFFNGNVVVNGVQLGPADMAILAMTIGVVIPGVYWYDRQCGAYGLVGGPCMGAIRAGLSLGGGRLAPDASGRSGTCCFINGRELHTVDVMRLQAMGVMTLPGHWWLDANGTYGMLGNLYPLGNIALQGMASTSSGSWSGQPNSWSTNMSSYGGTGGYGYSNPLYAAPQFATSPRPSSSFATRSTVDNLFQQPPDLKAFLGSYQSRPANSWTHEEAKRKAAEEAKREAEEKARRDANDFKMKVEEMARQKVAEEAKRRASEDARKRVEEESRKRAEEEARKRAEEQARKKAEEERKRKDAEHAKKRAEEAAKRRAAEQEARKRAHHLLYKAWERECSLTFSSSRPLQTFPQLPPSACVCTDIVCQSRRRDSGLSGCRHDYETLLRASGCYSLTWLRRERNKWHTDKFGNRCDASCRESLKRMAEETFKIYGELMDKCKSE